MISTLLFSVRTRWDIAAAANVLESWAVSLVALPWSHDAWPRCSKGCFTQKIENIEGGAECDEGLTVWSLVLFGASMQKEDSHAFANDISITHTSSPVHEAMIDGPRIQYPPRGAQTTGAT